MNNRSIFIIFVKYNLKINVMKKVSDVTFYNVYGLVDPITNVIFYVGCTSMSLEERLRNHYDSLREAMNTDRRKVNTRLKYLSDLLPNIASCILLEKVIEDVWEEKEKYYINKYRKLNPNLTNVAIGGIGGDTYTYLSDEDKAKRSMLSSKALKGRKKPEGFAKHLSETRMGINNPAARPSKYGNVVKINDDGTIHKIYKYGFELNEEFDNLKHGQIVTSLNRADYLKSCHLSKGGYYWNYEHNLKYNPIVNVNIIKERRALGGKNSGLSKRNNPNFTRKPNIIKEDNIKPLKFKR